VKVLDRTVYAAVSAMAAVALLAGFPTASAAQDNVMIVFDASGSMYGRVNGDRSKLQEAKAALEKVITRWGGRDINAGLVTYGHRRKSDCSDIETLIEPGPIDVKAFKSTISKIVALGTTPLSAAVKRAAEEMEFQSKNATVILMSDGKETCDVDPCELARSLERSGASFTAHVIALAVKEEDEAGLRCLAEETGGRYIKAANAAELTDAFLNVSAPAPIALTAVAAGTDRVLAGPLTWVVVQGSERVRHRSEAGTLTLNNMTPGEYTIIVRDNDTEARKRITIAQGEERSFQIEIEQPESGLAVTGPRDVFATEVFNVIWRGPNARGDKVQLAKRGAVPGIRYAQSFETKDYAPDQSGSFSFTAPLEPGEYELRYYSGPERRLLVRERIIVKPMRDLAEIAAVDPVAVATAFSVNFKAQNVPGDLIVIAKRGAAATTYISAQKAGSGSQTELRAPNKAGAYELRYISRERVLATQNLIVEPAEITLFAVEVTEAGQLFEVSWTGPGHRDDWVALGTPDGALNQFIERATVRDGDILEMGAPREPGSYELTYVNGTDGVVLAKRAIEVR